MKKLSCLVLSLSLSGCIFYQIPSRPKEQQEQKFHDLRNGYVIELTALNLANQEANKLLRTYVKTYTGTHFVENSRDAILRLCELVDGDLLTEEGNYGERDMKITMAELKEYQYRTH